MGIKKQNREQSLLHLLSDGHFHSGKCLGELLGVTRAAIWKMIRGLQQRGINIHSVNGKGYRIPNGLCLLEETKILKGLESEVRAKLAGLNCFDTIDSTNDYSLKQVNIQNPRSLACFAEQQTAG